MEHAPLLLACEAHGDNRDGFRAERRENNGDHGFQSKSADRLESMPLRRNDQPIQEEFEVKVGEVQSVFVQVGEALGVVPGYDDGLFVSTKKWPSTQIAEMEIAVKAAA
jgi:hypothetical protein